MAGNNPFDKSGGGTATATKPRGGLAAAGGENGEPKTVTSTSRDPFALPSTGGGGDYKFTEFLGELLLIRPVEEDFIDTKLGANTPCIRVDVVRMENDNEKVDDLLVFQSALMRDLKKVLRGNNEWMLGRLELGQARNGKSAPYIFGMPTSDDVTAAEKVMDDLGLR